uniref:hypothetical protein n=1 Tax=Methanothrix sp. TaxID=90426 RepID=UPI0032AF5A9F
MTIFKDQVGVSVTLDTGISLSGATLVRFNVVRPDGTTTTWAATASSDTTLQYTTQEGELSQAGVYLVIAYVEFHETSKTPGDPYVLEVQETDFSIAAYTNNPTGRPIDAVRLELGKDLSLALLTDSEI